MMPHPFDKYDFTAITPIDTMLLHPKLQNDKYGSESQKTIRINLGKNNYDANAAFLRLLKSRYGNVTFREALEKWEEDK